MPSVVGVWLLYYCVDDSPGLARHDDVFFSDWIGHGSLATLVRLSSVASQSSLLLSFDFCSVLYIMTNV